jgi:hypothetical protein
MGGVLELCFLIMVLGAKGFTRAGLPFSSRVNLTGARGRAVGAACLLLGFAGVAFAYGASGPADRERLGVFARGIIVGVLGAALVLVWHGPAIPDDDTSSRPGGGPCP